MNILLTILGGFLGFIKGLWNIGTRTATIENDRERS